MNKSLIRIQSVLWPY